MGDKWNLNIKKYKLIESEDLGKILKSKLITSY